MTRRPAMPTTQLSDGEWVQSGLFTHQGRDMTAVVFDREYGEVQRQRFDAAMCR